jgi:hypothetical protein
MTRSLRLFVVLTVTLGTAAAVAGSSRADHSTGTVRYLSAREDRFFNWDFRSQTSVGTNVDWPMNLLFFNGASIDYIKSALDPPYGGSGSSMYAKIDESGWGWAWDSDPGRKKGGCWWDDQYHYRIYADGPSLYNMSWGYYVLGTSHIDHNHCNGGWSGMSEVAEEEIAWDTIGLNWSVYGDYAYWYNAEYFRVEGNHVVDSNGYTTYIDVRLSGGGGGGGGPDQPMGDEPIAEIR